MNPELTTMLYERYPKIFKEHSRAESQMSGGFACGDEWFDLILTRSAICCNSTSTITARRKSLQGRVKKRGLPASPNDCIMTEVAHFSRTRGLRHDKVVILMI